jgi:hypothetical protein
MLGVIEWPQALSVCLRHACVPGRHLLRHRCQLLEMCSVGPHPVPSDRFEQRGEVSQLCRGLRPARFTGR